MASQFCRPAQLDRAHHATLDASKTSGMHLTIGLAAPAEDVRHLQTS
jgi:hypothetical protein